MCCVRTGFLKMRFVTALVAVLTVLAANDGVVAKDKCKRKFNAKLTSGPKKDKLVQYLSDKCPSTAAVSSSGGGQSTSTECSPAVLNDVPCSKGIVLQTSQRSGGCPGGYWIQAGAEFCFLGVCPDPSKDYVIYRGSNEGCTCPGGKPYTDVGLYGTVSTLQNVCPSDNFFFKGEAVLGNCYICEIPDVGIPCQSPECNQFCTCVRDQCVNTVTGSTICGDPHFVGFDGTHFDVMGKEGLHYALVSEKDHVINARLGNVGPIEVVSLWMTELGFVYKNSSVSVQLAFDTYVPKMNFTHEDASRMNRMLVDHLSDAVRVTVNGESYTHSLKSDSSLKVQSDELLVFFPSAVHENDPTDGPLVVLRNSVMEVSILLETEGVLHLDFSMRLLGPTSEMHGLIGQTVSWDKQVGNNVIQGEEDDYIVPSLLSQDFKWSKFGDQPPSSRGRKLGHAPKIAGRTARSSFQSASKFIHA